MTTPEPVRDGSCDGDKQKSMGEWLLEVDKAIHVPGICVHQGFERSGCFCLYCRVTSKIYKEALAVCEKVKNSLLEINSDFKSAREAFSVHPIGSFKSNVKVLACDEFDFLIVFDHKHDAEDRTKLVVAQFQSLMTSLQISKQKLSLLESSLPGVKFLAVFQHGPAWCFDMLTYSGSHPARFQIDISLAVRHSDLLISNSQHEYLKMKIFSSVFASSPDSVVKLDLCPDKSGKTMALVQEKLFLQLHKITPNILVLYRMLKVFAALFFPQRVSRHEHAPDGFLHKSFINPHLIKEVLFWQVEQNPDPSYWKTERTPQRLIDILWSVYKMRKEYFGKEENTFKAIIQWLEKDSAKFLCCSNNPIFADPLQDKFGFLKYESYQKVLTLEQFQSALPEDGEEMFAHLSVKMWDISLGNEFFRSFLVFYYGFMLEKKGLKETLIASSAEDARVDRLIEAGNVSNHYPVLQAHTWTYCERELFSCFSLDATLTNLLEEKGYVSLKLLEVLSDKENLSDFLRDNILTSAQRAALRNFMKQLPLLNNSGSLPKDVSEFLELMNTEKVPGPCTKRFKQESSWLQQLIKNPLKVLNSLQRYQVLDNIVYGELKHFGNTPDLASKLVSFILEKGAFPTFVQALKDTKQAALMKMMLDRISGRSQEEFNGVVDIEISPSIMGNANTIQREKRLNDDISQSLSTIRRNIEELESKVIGSWTGSVLIGINAENLAIFEAPQRPITILKLKEFITAELHLESLADKHKCGAFDVFVNLIRVQETKPDYDNGPLWLQASTDENNSFFEACRKGDIAVLNEVEHPELFRDAEGRTGLHLTIDAGHFSCASLLTSKGLDVNLLDNNGSSALHVAAINQQTPMINLLVESGANLNLQNKDGETAFLLAVKSGNPDIIKLLHDYQADIDIMNKDGQAPIHVACCIKNASHTEHDKHKPFEPDVEDLDEPLDFSSSKLTFPQIDSIETTIDTLLALLKMSINPNEQTSQGKAPLSIAAEHGSLLHVTTLLEHGADPSVADNRGWLPIHAAAHRGSADFTETLLTAVLYYSVSKHHPQRAPVLNPRHYTNIKTGTGLTPLMLAVRSGSRDCADILLKRGADVEMQDAEGMRALHFACRGNHRDAIELLLKHGAKTDVFNKRDELPVSLTTNRDCSTLIIHHDRSKREVAHPQFDPGETCDICTELLTDPRVLECGHVFCVTCLEKLTSPENSIPCPSCRQVTELLPGLLPKHLPSRIPRPSTTATDSSILLEQVNRWSLDYGISAVVVDEKRHLVYVGHGNTKPNFTGEPISVYTFSGKLVNRIKDNYTYPPVAIDTKRDLILRAGGPRVCTFTTEGELVRTITSPEIKHLEDICYQVCEDRYVVAESHCLHFICADTGKVLKSVPAEEARAYTRGKRNVFMAASRSPHSSTLVTADWERNLVKLYDGKGNLIRSYTGAGLEAVGFQWPEGVCFDHQDRILVCDRRNRRLVRISPDTEDDTRSCEVILDTSSLGLGHPRHVDVTVDGLLVMAFYTSTSKGPFNIAVFTGYQ